MLKTIPIQGITARGRNGYFKAASVDIMQLLNGTTSVFLSSDSKLTKHAPVMLSGSREQVLAMLDEIRRTIREGR
jgi:hypothetical protein